MRILSALTAVAVLATVPLASYAQSPSSDDHKAHHPAQAQAAPAAPGSMDMKGGAAGGMMGGGMMGGGDMSRMMAMMHGGMMGGGMMAGMPLKHVEGRLAFLKTELKITSAQEPQWAKFADTVRSTAKNAQGAMPPMMQGGAQAATAPDLLGRYEKTLAARLETVRALKAAFDPLYTSLSDEQKKAADELLTGPMGIL
ncbi:MAG: Spy/CpxP family protein refolding chaperone [Reyranella sp.]